MHVVFIATPDLSYLSGSSLSLRYTVEALARRGVECTVLCQHAPRGADAPRVRYVELPMPLDYQVITDSTPSSGDLEDCLSQLTAAVVGLPDVDLVHAIYGTFTGVAALVAGALRRVPSVVSTFGRDLMVGAVVDDRYRRLMRISYGHADLVLASDEAVAKLVRSDYAGPATRVEVVPPGVNFGLFRTAAADRRQRQADGSAPARHRVLAVQSSFNEKKGLSVLLDAFAEVRRVVSDVELVVAGHDDTPHARIERALRRQAGQLGITGSLRFVGHLPHEQVAELMVDCDAVVDPRTINSFSSCIFEAMAAGTPVVASDVPCNQQAIGGDAGVLTRAGDRTDLAAGIVRVLTDHELSARLRAVGSAYAVTAAREIGSEAVAERMHDLYAGLTGPPVPDDLGRAPLLTGRVDG